MNDDTRKQLQADPDGLATYEYLANHVGECDDDLPDLVERLRSVDITGQFMASAARFLHAIDSRRYAEVIRDLVAAAIDRDREHRYLGDLMLCIYGNDCLERAAELSAADNNFRRIYKRLYPTSVI